ncbi:MAG: transporter substrate-binding domain-containing protein [Ruminococcus sp.]|nr:transporter substrate-binding domain-containing protein [Ruminococcus sp.]
MKKKIALIMAVLLLVTSVFALAGCSKKEEKPEETKPAEATDMSYVKDKGTLVVGITDFKPMDYQDKDGKWIGFDAELAEKFAESLGVKVELKEINWDNKVSELNSKTIDCVWNGMTLSDEVLAAMDCSNAYCNNAQVTVFKKADLEKYKTAADCKDITFAVESGSAGEAEAKAAGFNTIAVGKQADALMEVKAGTSNAAIIDKLMAAAMVGEGTSYADLAYSFDLNSEEYGVGFRKGSDLVAELNKFLDACKADGSMKALAEKYSVQAAVIL